MKFLDRNSSLKSEPKAEDVKWAGIERALLGRVLRRFFFYDGKHIKYIFLLLCT